MTALPVRLLAILLCTGCFHATHTFVATTPDELHNSPVVRVRPEGIVRFVNGSRKTPAMFVGSLALGAEGICIDVKVSPTIFWQALRISEVDARIARAVLVVQPSLRIVSASATSLELEGTDDALRTWMVWHLRETAKTRRRFVDIPPIAYSVRTRFGWAAATNDSLVADTRSEGTRVGWRWNDFTRIEYDNAWVRKDVRDDELRRLIANNEPAVRSAIRKQKGLAAGPCPLAPK